MVMFKFRLVNSILNGIFKRSGAPLGCRLFHASGSSHVHKSTYPDVDIPNVTITELVLQNFKEYGTKTAFIDGVNGRSLTFDQVKDAVWRIASGMSKQGYGKGDVLMMISENSIDYVLVMHAALSLGGIITTCNNHYLTDDIVRQALHSSTGYVYCSQVCSVKTKEAIAKIKGIKKVFVSGNVDGFVPMTHLLEDDGACFPSHPVADSSSIAVLPYSSGTTGLPKGVMISHHNLVANCKQIDLPDNFPEDGPDNQLALLPFYHIYGAMCHCHALVMKGKTNVVMAGFEPLLFLQCIQKYSIGMIHVVPPIVAFLAKHEMVSKFDLSSLSRVVSGAAPMGIEIVQQFTTRHPHATVTQGYGMTEASPTISINSIKHSVTKSASSGLVVPNTYVKIVDSEERELPAGERGELCVKGPQVMVGYLNNPEATSHILDEEGWLHTGDVCYMDGDEFLFVVDRVKELIKFKGLQVPPAELEDLLCSHPCVADAAVVGVPDEEAGELPKAFVSLKQNAKITLEELNRFINERVPSYKRLRGGISFVSQVPRSPSGKILRKDLKLQQQ